MSVHTALETALAPGTLAPRRMDTSTFCGFDEFDLLQASSRELIAADDADVKSMRAYEAVSGHFSLATLQKVASSSEVGTILREPRARTISLYMYWRIPHVFDLLAPYDLQGYACKRLDQFLDEPLLAPAVDNQVCRMLLHGDPRLPDDCFMAEADTESVASDAVAQIDKLGSVGIVELGESAWTGLAQLFGISLESRKVNVTGELGDPVQVSPHESIFTAESLALLECRNAADRIVYGYGLKLAGVQDSHRSRFADSAFETQVARSERLLTD